MSVTRSSRIPFPILLAITIFAGGMPAWASGPDTDSVLASVRAGDMRLATIGYRLSSANAALCDRLEPGTGLQLHSVEQYSDGVRAEARRFFHFSTAVAVEGVVPGSPAARAGVAEDTALTGIGPVSVSPADDKAEPSTRRIIDIHAALAALPPEAPLVLHPAEKAAVTIVPVPICRTRFELKLDDSYTAQADGTMVQIGSRFLDTYDDDELAALLAHELSHNILHHRERLEAKGVSFGMLAGFGGNVKYFRQTETEADILSVYLLANAGYDPQVAVRFWDRFGRASDMGGLADRTHPGWKDRKATVAQEAAKIAAQPQRPLIPALLATRDKPLDGDWQSLLVRAR